VPPSCALLGGFAIGARVALRNVSEYVLVLAVCLVTSCDAEMRRVGDFAVRTCPFDGVSVVTWQVGLATVYVLTVKSSSPAPLPSISRSATAPTRSSRPSQLHNLSTEA